MNRKNMLVLTLLAVLLVGGIIIAFWKADVPTAPIADDLSARQAAKTHSYTAPDYGLAFSYSSTFYLKEHLAPEERPQLSVMLVEDNPENRALLNGTAEVSGELPPAIAIDVYPNADRLPAEDWVRADTNWTVRTSDAAPVGRGSITGVTYSWSGLYEGKSIIVTEGAFAYVFSVTWLSPEDPIIADFNHLLESVVLTAELPR